MEKRAGPRNAVIVDSWPMIRIGLTRVLQSSDISVVGEATDPDEGLALLRTKGAELLVLGEHTGLPIDVILEAKKLTPPPVVVVLLGHVGRAEITALLAAGCDALLGRSASAKELLDAVACCVDGERFVAPNLLPELAGMVDGTTASVQLTDKEREVLARLADGHTNSEIAAALLVSASTVKTHLNHIYGKLGARSRHEALARAVALGLLH